MLLRVAERPGVRVEIVSGRDPTTLGRWFCDLPIALRAEHGAWRRPVREKLWVSSVAVRMRHVRFAADALRRLTAPLGGWVERKLTGAAWHYRGIAVPADALEDVSQRLSAQLEPIKFTVLRGACVIEARSSGVDKGDAVHEARRTEPGATVVAVGDDTTDEDMFRALPLGPSSAASLSKQLGILVGDHGRKTAASHRFTHVADVRAFLAVLGGDD